MPLQTLLYFASSYSELLKKYLIVLPIAILYENWFIATMRIATCLETSPDESEGMGEANLKICLVICDSATIYHPQQWDEEKFARVRSFSQPRRKKVVIPMKWTLRLGIY
jgi:hypothetical protein